MMFVLRGIAISLTFFVLAYCVLSLLVVSTWRVVERLHAGEAAHRANRLFWLRVSPLLVSASIMLGLVVPAYVRLEPRSIDEDIALPLVLALGCLLLFALGFLRVRIAQQRSARVIAEWLNDASAMDAGITASVYRVGREAPPLTVVGVCSPRVVISDATMHLLSQDELQAAVRHELAHIQFRDNLKKLVFHCAPFPGMGVLEQAWHEAAELAADDCAVSSAREALDLAAALIKLSRLVPAHKAPAFTMALVGETDSLSQRVARLLAWTSHPVNAFRLRLEYLLFPAFAGLSIAVNAYHPALSQIHRLTELLVR